MGERPRVPASGNSSDLVDPANAYAHCGGAASKSGAAYCADRTTIRPLPTEKNKIKDQNTPSELHSADRHVSGFLQVVPIETASARVFLCYRPISRPRQSR